MTRNQMTKAVLLIGLLHASAARATWSIVIADLETKEVAVGTVTCLTGLDLLAIVPVVVVGKGAAAVQASGDFDGIRRPIIFSGLMHGTSPAELLEILEGISGHSSRQYGIADTQGETITFTGNSTSQWAGGVIGQDGSMVYAIQGNVLAGDCVLPAIEQAVLETTGDIAAKLMAGMIAARQEGGDGRCSCSSGNPTGCGCPPPDFDKSGHIGGMVVARIGDADDPACNASGCVDGDYFMRLNVPFQSSGSPDPVIQLEGLFNEWRESHAGRPDAVRSTVDFDPGIIPPTGVATTSMQIALLDWEGNPIDVSIDSATVEHSGDSDGLSTIGEVTDEGGGMFFVSITAGNQTGLDRFTVIVDDGIRLVVLMPAPALEYFAVGNCDGDDDVDLTDYSAFANCFTGPEGDLPGSDCACFDFDANDHVDLLDFGPFQGAFTGGMP